MEAGFPDESPGAAISNVLNFPSITAEEAPKLKPPLRSAAIQSPLGTRTPAVVPFQVKTTSLSKLTVLRSTISP